MVKIIIFGATGGIGRQVVNQALQQGHVVTAFARHADKVGIQHPNLSIASGDVMDPVSVERAIAGQDAVLVSIGAGRKGQDGCRQYGHNAGQLFGGGGVNADYVGVRHRTAQHLGIKHIRQF